MTCLLRGLFPSIGRRAAILLLALPLCIALPALCAGPDNSFFIDCSASSSGDGSSVHPWNSLADAQAHVFAPGDTIAVKRGTVCHGGFSPQGSGAERSAIRLTAYGEGPRPRIAATANDRQALLLFNQQYWQVDSLDLSGSSTYGVFVSGDKGRLHGISLKNLFVHDVRGGAMKNKDNGLVVVGPGSRDVFFDDVLIDGVVAAHTTQWAGILIGGGPFPYAPDAPLNTHAIIRNSSVEDVQGDGIVLFRVSDGLIETSAAHETGMQPTQTVGTPNAIWTWTCTDCTVRDNEAYLTDSPGVDGGAYDIDWDDTRNTVERNFAHDTQGYCVAVFGAGFVTSQSVIRDNACIDNGLSPRLAAMQGAIYLSTWNGGTIDGLRIEHNTIDWSPFVSSSAAVVDEAAVRGTPIVFTRNRVVSSAPLFYRAGNDFAPAENSYRYSGAGDARFTLGDKKDATLGELQAAGIEKGSKLQHIPSAPHGESPLRLEATIGFTLDADGLLANAPRAQLMVLKSLSEQYGRAALKVTVHVHSPQGSLAASAAARANALRDLDAGEIEFDEDRTSWDGIRLLAADGRVLEQWHGFQNAATLGLSVRSRVGSPHYPAIALPARERKK